MSPVFRESRSSLQEVLPHAASQEDRAVHMPPLPLQFASTSESCEVCISITQVCVAGGGMCTRSCALHRVGYVDEKRRAEKKPIHFLNKRQTTTAISDCDTYTRCQMLQISVPGPGFLPEKVAFSSASSCSVTGAPSGTLSCACGLHLTPAARAVAIESRENCLKNAGYRRSRTNSLSTHLKTLEKGTISGGVFHSKRRCSALFVVLLPE